MMNPVRVKEMGIRHLVSLGLYTGYRIAPHFVSESDQCAFFRSAYIELRAGMSNLPRNRAECSQSSIFKSDSIRNGIDFPHTTINSDYSLVKIVADFDWANLRRR